MKVKTLYIIIILTLLTNAFDLAAQQKIPGYNFSRFHRTLKNATQKTLPTLKNINVIMRNISSKNALVYKKNRIESLLLHIVKYAKTIKKAYYSVASNWRGNFYLWFGIRFPVFTQTVIISLNHSNRIKNIPGCRNIMNGIKKKFLQKVFNKG